MITTAASSFSFKPNTPNLSPSLASIFTLPHLLFVFYFSTISPLALSYLPPYLHTPRVHGDFAIIVSYKIYSVHVNQHPISRALLPFPPSTHPVSGVSLPHRSLCPLPRVCVCQISRGIACQTLHYTSFTSHSMQSTDPASAREVDCPRRLTR